MSLNKMLGFLRTALAFATTCTPLTSQSFHAHVEKPARPLWNTKIIPYAINNTPYTVRLCGNDNYTPITSVSQALTLLQQDNSASFIAAGNFNDGELCQLRDMFERATSLNPHLISDLEMVLVRGDNGTANWASSNNFTTQFHFDERLREYAGKKPTVRIDYECALEYFMGDIVVIPQNDTDAQEIYARIQRRRNARVEGFDFVYVSVDGGNFLHFVSHELSHLIFGEQETEPALLHHLLAHATLTLDHTSEHSQTTDSSLPFSSSASRRAAAQQYLFSATMLGKSRWSAFYAKEKRDEALEWKGKKKRELSALMTDIPYFFCSEDMPPPLFWSYLRTVEGLTFYGQEGLEETYDLLLDNASVDFQFKEWFAENGVSILFQDGSYRFAQGTAQQKRAQHEQSIGELHRSLKQLKIQREQEADWQRKLRLDRTETLILDSLVEHQHTLDTHGYGEQYAGHELWVIEHYFRCFGK